MILNAIVRASLRRSSVVLALAALLVAFGLYTLGRTKVDVFPEFAPPLVVVQSEAPGLSPEEVEQLVTQPVEQALNGVPKLETLRSQSIQGLSVVTAIFEEGTDLMRARQLAQERLSQLAGRIPAGLRPPVLAPLTSSMSVVYAFGLTSDRLGPMELRTLADWTLKPRLLEIPGVSKLSIFGGEVRQIQIRLRPARLQALGLGLNEILETARNATGVRGAGFIETANQRVVLQAEGQNLSALALGQVAIRAKDGAVLRLKDVAEVVDGPEPAFGAASIEGKPGVSLVISDQPGANTLDITRDVERALRELRPALEKQGVVLHERLFRPASFVETALANVRFALLLGGLLVAATIFAFLGQARPAFITLTAIPLSLLAATTVIHLAGASLNTMTLGGLAIALGVVVDDAIVDLENILRRLRLNRASERPRPPFDVVLDASIEVRGAVVYATFIVGLVMLPVLTLSGVQGRIFSPLGWAYLLAILASLLVALTVTPALTLVLAGRKDIREHEPAWVRAMKKGFHTLLDRVTARPKALLWGSGLLIALGLGAIPFFKGSFLPEFREGHFIVHMSLLPGASLQESLRVGQRVQGTLMALPSVRTVSQRVGRAEAADDTWGPHYSEFDVDLKPLKGAAAEEAMADLRKALLRIPGADFAIKTFLTERIEEVVSGQTAQVVVKLSGNDLDALDAGARDVAEALRGVPGAADVAIAAPPGIPQVRLKLRPERLAQHGLSPVAVLEALQVAFQGLPVAQVFEGNRVVDVAVTLDPALRLHPERLGLFTIRSPEGRFLPLSELADIVPGSGRYAVQHEGAQRVAVITCNAGGRDLAAFVRDAESAVGKAKLAPDLLVRFTGAAEAQARSHRELLVYTLLSMAGIFLILYLAFRNLRNAVLVLANLPFALVGGVLAVLFAGGWVNLGSLVGFVTLFGISTRNSIMLISHYEHLVHDEGEPWGLETALRGAEERLVPILMTALVTGLGLLPLALGAGDPGREIEGPMAIVILGGLVTSTALNLLLIPALALRYGRFGLTEDSPITEDVP